MELEIRLYKLIEETYEEIKDMTPEDGFCSPRDFGLVADVNKKTAIMDKLQEAIDYILALKVGGKGNERWISQKMESTFK